MSEAFLVFVLGQNWPADTNVLPQASKHLRCIGDQAIPWRVAPQQSPLPLHLADRPYCLPIHQSTFGHRSNAFENLHRPAPNHQIPGRTVFEGETKAAQAPSDESQAAELYEQIDRLKVQLDLNKLLTKYEEQVLGVLSPEKRAIFKEKCGDLSDNQGSNDVGWRFKAVESECLQLSYGTSPGFRLLNALLCFGLVAIQD